MSRTSCGVLVTDGHRLLLGHATRSTRWDIPKGLAEPGEAFADAACRELLEETGLAADPANLTPLGVHRYMPGKALALFRLDLVRMPDPAVLVCRSMVAPPNGQRFPEFDRFAVCGWDESLGRVGKAMAQLLGGLGSGLLRA